MRAVGIGTILAAAIICGRLQAGESAIPAPPYRDDPEFVKQLEAIGDNTMLVLPCPQVPEQRDYSNKMVYMRDRQTAFYCGGGHNGGRWCDAWEYHLGSNKWHELFPKQGGDHGLLKNAVYYTVPQLLKDPNAKIEVYPRQLLEQARAWWPKNVVLKDGHLVTPGGGPLMNCHLWDGITYDEKARKIVWITGGGNASMSYQVHAYFTGQKAQDVAKQMDWSCKPIWMFDPFAKQEQRWIHYRTKDKIPNLSGMGGSMTYIPELGKTIYYMAAANVSPANFVMATWDVSANKWQEIQPNLQGLAGKSAPMSEAQHAYSARHKKIVAVHRKNTYAYDIVKNQWSKLNESCPISNMYQGDNDCGTIFGYDSFSDVWLLCDPRAGKLAAYSLTANKWEPLTPQGPGFPKVTYNVGHGYFDPKFNVFVLFPSSDAAKLCLYRYKKAPAQVTE